MLRMRMTVGRECDSTPIVLVTCEDSAPVPAVEILREIRRKLPQVFEEVYNEPLPEPEPVDWEWFEREKKVDEYRRSLEAEAGVAN